MGEPNLMSYVHRNPEHRKHIKPNTHAIHFFFVQDRNSSSVNSRLSVVHSKQDYNQLAKRTEYTMNQSNVTSAKLYGGSKPRVCISPTPSIYYVDNLQCSAYNPCGVDPKNPRRSSMPILPKNRYAEVAPTRSCLSPSPSRKTGFFPKERKEVFLHSPRASVDEEEKTGAAPEDTKVNWISVWIEFCRFQYWRDDDGKNRDHR